METRFPLFAPTGLWTSAKTLYFTALLEGFGDNKFSPTAKMAKPLGTFAIFRLPQVATTVTPKRAPQLTPKVAPKASPKASPTVSDAQK